MKRGAAMMAADIVGGAVVSCAGWATRVEHATRGSAHRESFGEGMAPPQPARSTPKNNVLSEMVLHLEGCTHPASSIVWRAGLKAPIRANERHVRGH